MFSLAFQAYRWCIEAMKEITVGLPVKVVVDVLRQASKVFPKHWGAVTFDPQRSVDIRFLNDKLSGFAWQ